LTLVFSTSLFAGESFHLPTGEMHLSAKQWVRTSLWYEGVDDEFEHDEIALEEERLIEALPAYQKDEALYKSLQKL